MTSQSTKLPRNGLSLRNSVEKLSQPWDGPVAGVCSEFWTPIGNSKFSYRYLAVYTALRLPLLLRESRECGSWWRYIPLTRFVVALYVPRNAGCVECMARPRVEVQRYVPGSASFKLAVIVVWRALESRIDRSMERHICDYCIYFVCGQSSLIVSWTCLTVHSDEC